MTAPGVLQHSQRCEEPHQPRPVGWRQEHRHLLARIAKDPRERLRELRIIEETVDEGARHGTYFFPGENSQY